jgi:hypothetical protein
MIRPLHLATSPAAVASAVLVSAAFAVSATAAFAVSAGATVAATDPSVLVFDQPASGTAVTVAYTFMPSKGHLAVYADDGGTAVRTPLGSAELAAGDHRNVKITLAQPPKSGQRLWVAMYRDTDNKAGFDPKADASVWGDALPVVNAFAIR